MRCQNCGWSNPDGATVCEKCKQPLESGQPSLGSPVVQESFSPIQENLRKTIRESRPYGSHSSDQSSPDSSTCPKCGYPLADGTEVDCGVYSYFEVNNKKYFALLPLKGEKELDFSQSYMLYEVEEDEEHNPIVLYIENDYEYAVAAQYFSRELSKK